MAGPAVTQGLAFVVNVDGVQQLGNVISGITRAIKQPKPAFLAMIKDFKKISESQFDTQGGRRKRPWPGLSNMYKASKDFRTSGKPIMVVSGSLKDSLTGGSGFVQRLGPRTLEVGTSNKIALIHQRGAQARKMPVTQKMRNFFLARFLAGDPGFHPLRADKTEMNIKATPKRRLIDFTKEDGTRWTKFIQVLVVKRAKKEQR